MLFEFFDFSAIFEFEIDSPVYASLGTHTPGKVEEKVPVNMLTGKKKLNKSLKINKNDSIFKVMNWSEALHFLKRLNENTKKQITKIITSSSTLLINNYIKIPL